MNKPISSFDQPKNHLKDHVYLITGATGGLGRETSLALAKLGATVILTARNEHKLDALYDQIEQEGYPTPAIISFDLEQKDDEIYKQLIQSIYNEFKRLDGIVHAACHMGVIGPIGSQDGSQWQKAQQVNVNSAAMLSKVCLPLLQQSKHASISFISDSSARQSKAYWGAYGVSKVAIECFSSMLADELDATTVVSNVFIPGPCILPIRKKTHPGEEEVNLSTSSELASSLVNVILSEESGQLFPHQTG
ncbi:MAG: SDR family NAD(P)-dependent oxidoreductase [Cycloclasticus sp.]|jgi:NAD(P)-dependent dehydrogenase (short-subunit alcohol dehydrogenase family)|nr:SDR family NAD(P)-dependent oxidoreductase [Cycloclasticus sp.]